MNLEPPEVIAAEPTGNDLDWFNIVPLSLVQFDESLRRDHLGIDGFQLDDALASSPVTPEKHNF
jgi:hypothetical protein